jgi:hypothetical protein
MNRANIFYKPDEIAELLGVSVSSILLWLDSVKLKCKSDGQGLPLFSIDHLKEFAVTYNISMKFLVEPIQHEKDSAGNYYRPISIAQ